MARSAISGNKSTRSETDSFGPIDVPVDRYWGAQTERSRQNFKIGQDRMPMAIVHALGIVKLAAAQTNRELGLIDARRAGAITRAARWLGAFLAVPTAAIAKKLLVRVREGDFARERIPGN